MDRWIPKGIYKGSIKGLGFKVSENRGCSLKVLGLGVAGQSWRSS